MCKILCSFVSDVQISTFDWAELEKVRDLGEHATDDIQTVHSWPRSAVGNMSDCRYVSDCRTGGYSLILARSHTFMEADHEIISTAILLPSADSRRVVVSYKGKYVHKVLVNCLVKLAQEKSVVR